MTDDTRQTSDQDRQKRLERLLGGAETGPEAILYQHSILCQTGLPYLNPGDDARSAAVETDDLGRWIVDGLAAGPLSLEVLLADGRRVATEWVRV